MTEVCIFALMATDDGPSPFAESTEPRTYTQPMLAPFVRVEERSVTSSQLTFNGILQFVSRLERQNRRSVPRLQHIQHLVRKDSR